eukprot:snap_masked-scaffold_16-processed-gene-6.98-mRNA-1 protein AED:0.09 eAED:0.09 QI:55/0.75/0.77/1/0.75/0.55/9/742/330
MSSILNTLKQIQSKKMNMRRFSFSRVLQKPGGFHLRRPSALFQLLSEINPQGTESPVRVISVHSDQNKRSEMEDGHMFVDKFLESEDQALFAVFDGHGGKAVKNFLTGNFASTFEEILSERTVPGVQIDYCDLLQELYNRCDEKLARVFIRHSGATVGTCFVKIHNGKRTLFTANVGDTRIVLARGGKAIALTEDHTCLIQSERERVINLGGNIENYRVQGALAVTRAIGDFKWKKYVTSDPHLNSIQLTKKDNFVIVACDGVWDVVENQEAVDCITDGLAKRICTEHDAAKLLVEKAIENGSEDNITAMVGCCLYINVLMTWQLFSFSN